SPVGRFDYAATEDKRAISILRRLPGQTSPWVERSMRADITPDRKGPPSASRPNAPTSLTWPDVSATKRTTEPSRHATHVPPIVALCVVVGLDRFGVQGRRPVDALVQREGPHRLDAPQPGGEEGLGRLRRCETRPVRPIPAPADRRGRSAGCGAALRRR